MTVFWLVLVLMLLGVAAMSVGVLFGRKPITGSCGGVGSAVGGGGGSCEICGGNPAKCETTDDESSATGGKNPDFHNAGRK